MEMESENNYIGKIIAEKRIALGWSQDELARKMGYASRSTINKIEAGINGVTTTKAKKFAKVLGCSIQDFFQNESYQFDALYDLIKEDKRLQGAIRKYFQLDNVGQAMVLAYIDAQYDSRNEETVEEMLEKCVAPDDAASNQ